jgi:protein TonB
VYYDTVRRLIEDMGTTNFPTFGGKKLYGELTMLITVNHDGQVLATEVVDSSGIPVLDRRAELIARSAGPFGSFSDEMRSGFDQLVLVSRFKFTRDEMLEAKVSGK